MPRAFWFSAGLALIIVCIASIQYPQIMRRRYFFYLLVSILAAAGFIIDFRDLWGDPEREWQITALLGSTLIVLGWIFTNEMSLQSSRKQHTINLITTFVTNERRIQDKETIRRLLPMRIRLEFTHFNYADENHALAQAIDRELNFLEFIAIGINSGDLDERMAYRMLSGVVIFFVEQVRDYIDYWQHRDSETWEDVCDMYQRWKDRAREDHP